MWIIVVQFDSLTGMLLINWLCGESIDIYESPIDNIIFNNPSALLHFRTPPPFFIDDPGAEFHAD